MKYILSILIVIFGVITIGFCQENTNNPITGENKTDESSEIDFERPLNLFISAGASYRFGDLYDVSVSPTNLTVQFDKVFPVFTRITTGLVWNPFTNSKTLESVKEKFKSKFYKNAVDAARDNFAVALLINIFQLSYSAGAVNTTSPIDVGFGIGYRKKDFLALFTVEFTPLRQPRQYFIDEFNGKNKQFILSGTQEPVRDINIDDKSLFLTKIYPFIGFRIAYAFTSKKKEVKNGD